jgi:fatty-acyl-CoA synthase
MSKGISSTDWIAHHAERSPKSIACIDIHSDRTLTYAEFNDRISKLANALNTQFCIPSGARVLVLSRNDTDVFELQFACHRASVIFVPLNWRLSPVELEVIANDSAPSIIFYSAEFRGVAERVAATASIGISVELNNGGPGDYETCISRASSQRRDLVRSDDDIWALLYTSGTTGKPKGAQVTFGMALCNAIVLGNEFRIGSDCRNLVTLPTFHTAGLNVFANPAFFYGGTNLVAREFEPLQVVEFIKGHKGGVTHLMGVPTTHAMLAQTPDFDRIPNTGLREVCVAGAPCPASTFESYAAVGLSLRQCWGMTEVGPLALFMPGDRSIAKPGSSGLPSIFAKMMVADSEGNPVHDGQVGELLVKGPAVTSGYWERPDANAAAFNSTGWFKTGDAVYRDEDGYFFIVDRWKDMYISGGENVYPAEIENTLSVLEDVADCAVVGMPDSKWGEVGRAFIVRTKSSPLDAIKLKLHCEQRLARYKIPKEFVFVDELPRNASGKILKAKLREMQIG